ncbi:MAG: hypothetical protein K2G04_03990, partial [Oscillospiraceae bacterium]|nr:hypothetical protein [Oscillospiraceae bacterium]
EMADGLRQVGGKFDYTAENVQASKDAKLAELNAQLKALKDSAPIDIFKDSAYNTIDENKYGLDQAKALWADDKLDLNAEKDAYVDVTYTAKIADDGTVSYEVTGAVTDSGKDLMAKADLFEATAVNATGDATGKGGFKVTGDADAEVNVIFDASKIKDGDVITVRYNGPGKSAKAPANAGFADDSITNNTANNANLTKEADLSVAVKVEDADMTSDIVSVFDALNGAEVKFQVAANSTTNAVKATAGSVKLNIGGTDVTVTDAGAKVTFTDANGNSTEVWAAYANTGKLTLSTVNGNAKGTDLLEIDLGGWKNADTAIANASVKIAFDSYQAPSAGGVDAEVVASKGVGENEELNKQIAAVQKKIDDLNNGTGVSNSNAFGNGAIPLTYTDHIVLQSGARSKDAVDFTFRYSSGGMGKLKDNMNCSARADGLNTENLSLKTAEDANAAIDQIDHAINKVSMVRATFGAVQNRLEHKIDNMNVSIENLTSAESGIRDTNMPTEMMNFTKQQILAQASQSMLAQANQLPQSVLSLLQ